MTSDPASSSPLPPAPASPSHLSRHSGSSTHLPALDAQPPLPDQTPSADDIDVVDITGPGDGVHDEEAEESSHNKLPSRMSGLPSPPLTRVGSTDSIRERATHQEDATVADEDKQEGWHPLVDDSGVGAPEEDLSFAAAPHSTENDGADVDTTDRLAAYPSSDNLPSPTISPTIQRSNRFIHAKAPSPQPWDLVDPPPDNGQPDHDIYSTVGSRFNTLQSGGSTQRPLKPKSSYYFGPPPSDAAYHTPPMGQIGVHHPREILRLERDYTGGELIQFAPIYPLELEGRVTPTQFLESVNAINELLISAHSAKHSFIENALAVFTLQISRLFFKSHYEKTMEQLEDLIDQLNMELFNPTGLNMLWPRKVAFLFLEIEYY